MLNKHTSLTQPRIRVQAHIACSCTAFHPPVPLRLFTGLLQSFHLPVCTNPADCPDPCAEPCTWLCWTKWGSHKFTPQASQGCSEWLPAHLANQLHYSSWCHLQTCSGSTWSPCLCLCWFQYRPWEDSTCYRFSPIYEIVVCNTFGCSHAENPSPANSS